MYEALGLEFTGSDQVINEVFIDSRKPKPEKGLFVAIRGAHHDGHDFIDELISKGVKYFIVDQAFIQGERDAVFLVVPDCLRAFQQIAGACRATFQGRVIGVTGSNGKTIVKEWLAQLLLTAGFKVSKSPKSYNSQVGVPLSVLRANPTDDYFVFEVGISKKGEMVHLAGLLNPDAVLLTNIGSAHDEGFIDRSEKLKEKLVLATELVSVQTSPEVATEIEKAISWSNQSIVSENREGSVVNIAGEQYVLPFSDHASIENVMHCMYFAVGEGISSDVIKEWIKELKPVATRLEVKQGIQNTKLLSDYYNNDKAGFLMSLEYAHSLRIKESKTLIFSDISGLYGSDKEAYFEVQSAIIQGHFDRVIAIGPVCVSLRKTFTQWEVYESTMAFLETIDTASFKDQFILLKGARNFAFERIEERLIRSVHKTRFEINLTTLEQNLNYYREHLQADTKLMVMVKAFAYGSGDVEVARLLEYTKVDYLAVAYTDEGVALRSAGITLPIMVMNPDVFDSDRLRQFNLEPEIYSLQRLKDYAERFAGLKVHVKLDTGMHRLGFEEEDLDDLMKVFGANNMEVASVFSHLVGTDNARFDEFTNQQIELFEKMYDMISEGLSQKPIKHILNSGGIARFPEYQFDMARLGIGLYGFGAEASTQQIGTLISTVSQVRKVRSGESIGYSRAEVLEKDSLMATVAIGYADGYDRRFSKGVGQVLIKGELCPVVGNVCMDMTMVDVTGLDVKEGDEVVVYGPGLEVESLADKIGTISYELLTSIGQRIPRVFYSE